MYLEPCPRYTLLRAIKRISVNVGDSNYPNLFSNHKVIKLEINNKKCLEKSPFVWKQNNTLQNKLCAKNK